MFVLVRVDAFAWVVLTYVCIVETNTRAEDCGSAVDKKKDGTSIYNCSLTGTFQQHFSEIENMFELLSKYIDAATSSPLTITDMVMHVSDTILPQNWFDQLESLPSLKTTETFTIYAPDLEQFHPQAFRQFQALEVLTINDLPANYTDLAEVFCGVPSLKVLSMDNGNLTCSCNLADTVANLRRCYSNSLDVEGSCAGENGTLYDLDTPEGDKFCEEGDNNTPLVYTLDTLPVIHEKSSPSTATIVLIIILTVVLLTIIVFALVLFVSNRVCRKNKTYQSKSASNHEQMNRNANVVVGAGVDPNVVPTGPPKHVKFRPLSREYQSIDGCPFDTQIPVNTPEHKLYPQTNLPFSTLEQPEGSPQREIYSKNSGEMHL